MKETLVLVFGNPFLEYDNLAVELSKELKIPGVIFQQCASPQEIFYHDFDYILDVAKGIKKATIIDDIDKLKSPGMFSLHDFDLGYFLKMMKEMGKIKKVRIIAIPLNYEKEKAKKEIREILSFK